MYKHDGITWTLRTSAANYAWRGVTYGAGLFVAVASSGTGTGNRVMTSPDGITWTLGTSAADNYWNGVTYGAGLFVAVASSGNENRVMTSSSMVAPSITGFSIPVKTYGDAPFPITQPTSNSTGAFTYISDNSSVATINGTTGEITIVGPGQATITATQAATANYLSGTIDTTFTVSQSTQTNPVRLSSEAELLYFLTTSARYAMLTQTMEIKSVVNLTDVYTFL